VYLSREMGTGTSQLHAMGDFCTADEVKSSCGALYDPAWFDQHSIRSAEGKIVVAKAEIYCEAQDRGIFSPSQITLLNLLQFRRVYFALTHAYLEFPATQRQLLEQVADMNLAASEPIRFQQCGRSGDPVQSADELLSAATHFQDTFAEILHKALFLAGISSEPYQHGTGRGTLKLCPTLKKAARINAKAREEYADREPGPPFSWIFDVLRATIVLDTPQEINLLIAVLLSPDFGEVQIVRLKNRCAKPLFQGYRDYLINIAIKLPDGWLHVCELQIHLRVVKELALKLRSHETYEFFRAHFRGHMESAAERLEFIKNLGEQISIQQVVTCEKLVDVLLEKAELSVSQVSRTLATIYVDRPLVVPLDAVCLCQR
jgi:hypothetical protein